MAYDDETDDHDDDWRESAEEAHFDGDGAPTEEEVARLLGLTPEEVARLVVRRPALVQYLEVGVQAAIAAGSQEHEAKSNIAKGYFELNDKLVSGLLARLSASDVTEEERSTIYGLLDKTQKVNGEKATEFIEAQDRTGSKTLRSVGLFVMLGLAVVVVVARKQGPSALPPFLRG